jgi:hypothetical protein
MDRVQIAITADIISIVSGIITILGIGGILSWSFFKGHSGQLSNTVLGIVSYVLKIGLCLFLGVAFILLAAVMISTLQFWVLPLALTSLPTYNFYKYDATVETPARLIAVVTSILVLLPAYLLSCASVFNGSIEPWRRFISVFRHKKSLE